MDGAGEDRGPLPGTGATSPACRASLPSRLCPRAVCACSRRRCHPARRLPEAQLGLGDAPRVPPDQAQPFLADRGGAGCWSAYLFAYWEMPVSASSSRLTVSLPLPAEPSSPTPFFLHPCPSFQYQQPSHRAPSQRILPALRLAN